MGLDSRMNPRMSPAERQLFVRSLDGARAYCEFGAGGSTCIASQLVRERITTVDSSAEWLDRVVGWCTENGTVQPRALFADIGPVGDWGWPLEGTCRSNWPAYHRAVWATEDGGAFDTFMIDGRFRVACFMQVLLHCRPDATIMFHDFANRLAYHVVREVANEIESAENLSLFSPRAGADRTRIEALLAEFEYTPA